MIAKGSPDVSGDACPAAGSHAEAGATTCEGCTVMTGSADISRGRGEFSLVDMVAIPKEKEIEDDTRQGPHYPGGRCPNTVTV
jgi:hypothetical protein